MGAGRVCAQVPPGTGRGMENSDAGAPRSLDDAVDGHRFAMVTTTSGSEMTSRPLTLLEHDGATLRFLVSASASWAGDLDGAGAPVNVAFADPDDNTFASLAGSGSLTKDRALIDRLWNPIAGVYFDGEDDPDIAVLEVTVTGGEWWDGPSSKIGQAIDMARITLTGRSLDEHGDVVV